MYQATSTAITFVIVVLYISFIQCVTSSMCGNIFTTNHTTITNENHHHHHQSSSNQCFYLIKGNNCTAKFHIEFVDFNLKQSIGCIDERLEIGYQDALCGRKNGSKIYLAEKHNLKLKFIGDGNNGHFKLSINRIDDDCANDDETTTETVMYEWATTDAAMPSYLPPPPPPSSCCQTDIFSSKRFFLSSPNFPYTLITENHCVYKIRKANSNVCRLRIHFHFFVLGKPTADSCPLGYLEIDGKFICGCNTNLKLTTNFRNDDNQMITLQFHSAGMSNRSSTTRSGFIIEIIQDECSKRVVQNRFIAPTATTIIEQLPIIKEKTHFSDNSLQHIYIFASNKYDTRPDKEETTYIDTASINTLLTDYYGYYQCLEWNRNQFQDIQCKFDASLYGICSTAMKENTAENCQIFNELSGSFQTPGYPLNYDGNEKQCYRFHILPGYCSIQLYFNDFDIEPTYACSRSYIEINSIRYCGDYLKNKVVTIQILPEHRFQQINLIANYVNYYRVNKRFYGKYQQVPCDFSNVNNLPYHAVIRTPSNIQNDDAAVGKCTKIIYEKLFIIENFSSTFSHCYFAEIIVKKQSESICQLLLNFDYLNLSCETEYLNVNGHVHCGQLTEQKTITIDFTSTQNEIRISYFRKPKHFPAAEGGENSTGKFAIRGTQTMENCDRKYLPPPAKLLHANGANSLI